MEVASESGRKAGVLASIATLASIAAAVSCCLPLGALAGATMLAAIAPFFSRAYPLLVAASVALLAGGFVQAYRAPKCDARRRRLTLSLLWISLVILGTTMLFPQVVAGLLADHAPGR
jgi:hypothetical protein